VKRTEDGTLFVGKTKGRQPNVVEGKDPNGNPIYSDKVDMVVKQGGREKVDKMIYEQAIELLDKK